MTRTKLGPRRLVVLALAALLLPLVAFVAPAGATDPIPTTTRIFFSSSYAGAIKVNARVRSASGVPTGTVTFYEVGDPTPLDGPVPLDSTGRASIDVGVNRGSTPVHYRAEFHAANGYADSAGVDTDGGALVVDPEPTVLGIGGPTLLKVTLTTSAYVRRADGLPAENTIVQFTLRGPANGPADGNATTVCFAYTDINGLATCKGQGAGSAIVSILSGGAWATAADYPSLALTTARLPVIAFGK